MSGTTGDPGDDRTSAATPSTATDTSLHATRLALARVSIEEAGSLTRAFVTATEICARALNVERVGIWLFDDSGEAVQCVHLHQRSTNEHGPGVTLILADAPAYLDAIQRMRTVAANDVRHDTRTNELLTSYFALHHIVSTLDAPIFRTGELVGILCAEQVETRRDWTGEERDFAASVADMISLLWEESARVNAQKALAHREAIQLESIRLESLGRLAAGVAHDTNNLLQIITALASKARTAQGQDVAALATQIIDTARRAATLNRQILSFGRSPASLQRAVDLGATLERLRSTLTMAVQRRVTVTLQLPSDPVLVALPPDEIEQIALNLVLNARDASPLHSEVRVVVEQREGRAVLEVADRGAGMSAATREKIFEPFFTTKNDGEGTGLGLAIVSGLVARAGGNIEVQTKPNAGTTFRVLLPLENAPPSQEGLG